MKNGFSVGAVICAVLGVLFLAWPLLLPELAVTLLLAGVALLLVAFMLWRLGEQLGRFTYKGKKVLKNGIPAKARVTAVEESTVVVNQNPVLTVGLQVSERNKEPFDVTVRQLVPKTRAASVVKGAELDVRIDKADRRKVVIAFGA
jgi:hypothetical protein